MARIERARRVTRLVAVLSGQAKGCSIQQIMRATTSSRATAYRDLELLRDSGYTKAARSDAKAVKVWSTDPIDVRIRIAKPVARFVAEWPLTPTQRLETAPRGAIDVCARVYGLRETLRWVLRCGQGAEVRAPEELRELVRVELTAALAGYGGAERAGEATSRRPG